MSFDQSILIYSIRCPTLLLSERRIMATRLTLFVLLALLLPICLPHAYTISQKSRRLLVVLKDTSQSESLSKLFSSLRDKNFDLNVRTADEGRLSLTADGEYTYDGVVLLCPTVARAIPVDDLTAFLDAGHDVFVAGGPGFSEYTRNVAKVLGVDMGATGAMYLDHTAKNRWALAGGHVESARLFGKTGTRIHFRGPPATLFKDNELVDSVVWGAPHAYGAKKADMRVTSPLRSVGSQIVLGATLSTRSESRGVYWGSIDALTDEAPDATSLHYFVAWTFGHRGVIKVKTASHSREGESTPSDVYRVKDRIDFGMRVLEWNGDAKLWLPYVADDMQVELIMLDAWVRARLRAGENTTMETLLQVPDQIGVYKLRVEYRRPGLSHIDWEQVVPIRPFLHNEYKRFIRQATPYYVASFSMLVGVLILGVVLLYGDGENSGKRDSAPTGGTVSGSSSSVSNATSAARSGKTKHS